MNNKRMFRFWNRYAEAFERLYSTSSIVDRAFRRGIPLREDRVLEMVQGLPEPRVLDFGCGPGRQVLLAADAGASLAVGIDGAEKMIELARAKSIPPGNGGKVEFHTGDFFGYKDDRRYDLVWALGVFDYEADPDALLCLMKDFSQGTVVATFRRRWVFRYPVRKLFYRLRGCPAYFYSRREIERLFERNGLSGARVSRIDRALYFVTAEVGASAS